ncbi:hypothetical protein COU36_04220 [Candidatus Micrarchaeota archaeon CG10_big_fil_rev_8_21_14_0_10_59_7]|nr:MAG: hypothetical protein COU36_04220 [Candidatus Micrarchaeota archaeon CG10_big_fil_rev_8_21_14_0_10_59_7]
MKLKEVSKEGLAFLGSILIQLYQIISNQTLDLWSKILGGLAFLIIVGVVMYSPNGKGEEK